MHPELKHFVRQYLAVVGMTFATVVLATFLTIPMSLGYVPGATPTGEAAVDRHLT